MSQCNSRAELHRRMADVYDFCKGTVFEGREQECVKINRRLVDFPLLFAGSPYRYEFALGIVEDKPVWEGDELYFNGHEHKIKVDDEHDLSMPCWSWNPPAPPKPKTVSVSVNGGEPITLDQMVDRFLSWKLPEHFNPDAGISFKPEYNIEYMAKQGQPPMRHEPTGTNLFDADQARAMILYLFEGKL